MELVSPTAIADWPAVNHHGMTEQLPRTVLVTTDHPVRRPPTGAFGNPFKVVSLRPHKSLDWCETGSMRSRLW